MTMYLLIFILFTLIAIFWMKVFLNFKPEDSIGVLWLGVQQFYMFFIVRISLKWEPIY